MQGGKIIRTTISLCPTCRARIPAADVEEAGEVFMEKACPVHGPFRNRIARDARRYRDFFRFYALLHRAFPYRRDRPESAAFTTTLACDLRCPICFVGDNARVRPPEMPLPDVARRLTALRGRGMTFMLTGGESTVREDLPEIVRLIRRSGNFPVLVTNGVRLEDPEYLRRLAAAGLSAIAPWFDSVSDDEPYHRIRGRPMVAERKRLLGNARALGLKLIVFFIPVKGVNAGELPGILGMARENPEIFKIIVMGYMHRGAKGFSEENEYATDELWELIARASGVFSSLDDLYLAVKINLASRAVRRAYNCYNAQSLLMPRSDRKEDGFETDRWGEILRRFEALLETDPGKAKRIFLAAFGKELLRRGFLLPLAERFLLRRPQIRDLFVPPRYYWLRFQNLYYHRNYDEEMVRGFCANPSFNPGLEKRVSFCEYYNLGLKT